MESGGCRHNNQITGTGITRAGVSATTIRPRCYRHSDISFGLAAAPPHGDISFGLAAAPPLGDIDSLFVTRR